MDKICNKYLMNMFSVLVGTVNNEYNRTCIFTTSLLIDTRANIIMVPVHAYMCYLLILKYLNMLSFLPSLNT